MFTGIRLKLWDDMRIERVDPIQVPHERRKAPDADVTEAKRKSLRRLVGSLQYAAVHTRADMCAKVGELQSAIEQAMIRHLLEANKVLYEAKKYPVSTMVLPIAEGDLTFCAFSDASFASTQKHHAHQGSIIYVTRNKMLANQTAV